MSEILEIQRDDVSTDTSKGIKWREEQMTVTNVLKGVLRNGEVIFSTAKTKGGEHEI